MKRKSQYERYGFIDRKHMPKARYTSETIPYSERNWSVMRNFNDIAHNHCGATAATNITRQLAYAGNPLLMKNNSLNNIFADLHDLIGNGPVMTINSNLGKYISTRAYTLNHSRILTYSGLQKAISNNRPCALLLCASPLHWHWVVVVGWRQYDSGEKYLRIVTGWDNSANYYCRFPVFPIVTQYWISNKQPS